jgi:DNA-binding transcriptional LysR family regulator
MHDRSSRLPPPDLLVTFEAAARLRSFTLAAAERFVTPSAVSRQVAALEQHLGVPLFRRRHRALDLTDDGRKLADTVQHTLALLRATLAEIRAPLRREVLALTTTPGLASLWLIPRLAGFLASHPGVDVRIDATLEARDLAADGFDLAIRYSAADKAPGPPMFRERMQPVCAPALLRDPLRPLRSAADLRHHTLLQMAADPGKAMPAEWQSWLQSVGAGQVEPAALLSFNHFDSAVAAAVAGQGVLLGRRPLVDALITRGDLVTPLHDGVDSSRAYFILVEPGAAQRPAVAALSGWLLEQASQTVG